MSDLKKHIKTRLKEFVAKGINEALGSDYDDKIQEFAKELGYNLKEKLGSGEWGVAFLDDNGYVFKLTTNENEFYTAQDIEGRELNYFANVYSTHISEDENMMAIRKEYINPLSTKLKSDLNMFFVEFDKYYHFKPKNTVIFEDILTKGSDEKFKRHLLKMNNKNLSTIYQEFVSMFKEANDEGILLSDITPDNLGVKNKHLVLFDI
jgi:hypothetical protein